MDIGLKRYLEQKFCLQASQTVGAFVATEPIVQQGPHLVMIIPSLFTLRLYVKGELIATHSRLEGKYLRRLNRLAALTTDKGGHDPLRVPLRSLDLYGAIGEGLSHMGRAG